MIENIETIFDDLNILVIGDVILDHYLMGNVDRISPEAPVPVVLHQKEMFRLGGAANVALNIKAMGATPFLLSVVGEDFYAETFINLLEEEKIDSSYIIKSNYHQTTCKTRVLARQQQLLRYDREAYQEPDEDLIHNLTVAVSQLIKTKKLAAIVFQDYNKGLLTPLFIKSITQIAQENKVPILVDPKKTNFWTYQGSTVFKPNLKEIKEALDLKLEEADLTLEILKKIAKKIRAKLNNKITVITLGAKGIFVATAKEEKWLKTKVCKIADVCGAGDTVIAMLALGVAAEIPLFTTVELSNLAGGLVCQEVGVVPINKKKLLKEYCEKE